MYAIELSQELGMLLGHATGKPGKTTSRKKRSELGDGDLYDGVSRGRYRRALLFHLEGIVCCHVSMVGLGKPGHRDELSPSAHAPRLQDAEVGGVFSDGLRHAGPRRGTDFLGGHAPHSSSVLRPGWRSAFADRRQMVGAHGLDPDGQVDAP